MEIITKQLVALGNGVGAPIEDSSSAPSCLQHQQQQQPHHNTVQHSKLCWCPALLPALRCLSRCPLGTSVHLVWSGYRNCWKILLGQHYVTNLQNFTCWQGKQQQSRHSERERQRESESEGDWELGELKRARNWNFAVDGSDTACTTHILLHNRIAFKCFWLGERERERVREFK